MTVWNIFVGRGGEYLNEFNPEKGEFPPEVNSDGFVAVGWARVGDMTMYADNKKAYEENFAIVYKNESSQKRNCLWNFFNDIKEGDLIISRSSYHGYILVGEAVGYYFYDADRDAFHEKRTQTYLQNIRKVRWIAVIEKNDPHYILLSRNGGQFAVSKSHISEEELRKILSSTTTGSSPPASSIS